MGRILALTFTNKAAGELRQRVRDEISKLPEGLFIGTFHSFGKHVLESHGDTIGLAPGFSVFDTDDQIELISRLQRSGQIPSSLDSRAVAFRVNRLKGLLSVTAAPIDQPQKHLTPIPEFAVQYDAAMRRARAVDFADLIYLPNVLLAAHPERLELLQTAYRTILVDEFQDTTPGQYALLKRLSGPDRAPVFAVADEDQLIYEWNEARMETINNFLTDFRAEVTFASRSHRCPPVVVSAANSVIRHNIFRFPNKPAIQSSTTNQLQDRIALMEAEDGDNEAKQVSELVGQLVGHSARPNEIAILARANWLLDGIERQLDSLGIPAERPSTAGLGETEEAEFVLRLLKWIANPRDEQSMRVVLLNLFPNDADSLDKAVVENMAQGAEPVSSLWELAKVGAGGPGLQRFLAAQANWMTRSSSVNSLLPAVSSDLREVFIEGAGRGEESQKGILEAVRILTGRGAQLHPRGRTSVTDFLFELPKTVSTEPEGSDVTSLLTLHQSKGLEFPYVFIIGLENGILPDYRAKGQERVMEEERRLFYVGLTRARKRVFLSYARKRADSSGRVREREPSSFIEEIPENLIERLHPS